MTPAKRLSALLDAIAAARTPVSSADCADQRLNSRPVQICTTGH